MTIEVVWSRGRGWCTRACAECEVPSSSPNMDAFLSSPRFASVPHGDGKLWLTMVPLHHSRASDPAGRILLWSCPGRISTLVDPLPIFLPAKKKKLHAYIKLRFTFILTIEEVISWERKRKQDRWSTYLLWNSLSLWKDITDISYQLITAWEVHRSGSFVPLIQLSTK